MEGVPDLLVRPAEDVTSSWGFPVLEKVGMGGRVDILVEGWVDILVEGWEDGCIGGRLDGWVEW